MMNSTALGTTTLIANGQAYPIADMDDEFCYFEDFIEPVNCGIAVLKTQDDTHQEERVIKTPNGVSAPKFPYEVIYRRS